MLTMIGGRAINLDHVREIAPLKRTRDGMPMVRITFSNGDTDELCYSADMLDRLTGQIVPAPEGYVMASALLPEKGDSPSDISIFRTPVTAFRIAGGTEPPMPITVEGEPFDSNPHAVIRPDGKVSAEGDTFDSVEAWVKFLKA